MILAFDTTGKRAGICLYKSDVDFVLRESKEELHHLTELIPMLDKLLSDEGVSLSEIEAFAVSSGPGSFTGIRIGISTVRALAQVREIAGRARNDKDSTDDLMGSNDAAAVIPVQAGISDYTDASTVGSVISVPTLETFAFNDVIPGAVPESMTSGNIICPLFDARRSQVYAGAYTLKLVDGHPSINTLVEGGAYNLDDFFEKFTAAVSKFPETSSVKFYGDGAEAFAGGYKGSSSIADTQYRDQSALSTVRWATLFGEKIPYANLEPVYMRQAEAQRKLDAGIIKPRG
jgi:tRNA threonylcarbamoyladenosine biosynthesis protein TsaB